MKTSKIIKTLKFIKDYCKERDCFNCGFGNSGLCSFTDNDGDFPEGWDIDIIESNLKHKERIKTYD
jgi:hypothetical protein